MRCLFKIYILLVSFAINGFSQDSIGVTGIYQNHSYGFQVTIPRGLIGRWNSPIWKDTTTSGYISFSDHGRFIQLKNSDWVDIFSSYTRDSDLPLLTIVYEEIEYIKGKADSLSFILYELRSTNLGKLPAYHYSAKYEKNGKGRIAEGVIAFSAKEKIQFLVMLNSEISNYKNNVKLLKSICISWKRIKRF